LYMVIYWWEGKIGWSIIWCGALWVWSRRFGRSLISITIRVILYP
jgi:hypothetical protein